MSGMQVLTLLIFALIYTVCVAQEELCGPNEVYRSCGSACPPTCRNPNPAGTSCIALCVNGCFCKSGYLRAERTRKCVRPQQCPRY